VVVPGVSAQEAFDFVLDPAHVGDIKGSFGTIKLSEPLLPLLVFPLLRIFACKMSGNQWKESSPFAKEG